MYNIYYTPRSGIRRHLCRCEDENEMLQLVDKHLNGSMGVIEVIKHGEIIMYAAGA